MAIFSGKTKTLLYIAREVLHASSLNQVKIPFIITVVIVNLINLYIILTLSKYQTVYTKDELKALKEKEVKLSDLREVDPEEEKKLKVQRKKVRYITLACFAIFFEFISQYLVLKLVLIQHSQLYLNS